MKMKFCSLAFLLLLVIAQIEARIPDEHMLRALHRHRPVLLKRMPASYSHTHLHRTRFKRGQEPLEGVDGVEMVQKQGVDGVEMVQKQEVTELEQNIQTGPTNEQFSMDVPQDGIMTRKITYEMQPRVRLVRRTINVVPQTERVIKRTRIKMRYDSNQRFNPRDLKKMMENSDGMQVSGSTRRQYFSNIQVNFSGRCGAIPIYGGDAVEDINLKTSRMGRGIC